MKIAHSRETSVKHVAGFTHGGEYFEEKRETLGEIDRSAKFASYFDFHVG